MISHLNDSLTPLRSPTAVTRVLAGVINERLALNNPAPAMCKELAFEQFHDVATDKLIAMDEMKTNDTEKYLITAPIAELITYAKTFNVHLHRNFAEQDDFPDDFPVALIRNTYVCARDASSGKWTMTRAMELEEDGDTAVTFCNQDCEQSPGEFMVEISGEPADKLETRLLELWTTLVKQD